MKKTIIGTVLTIMIAWNLYFIQITNRIFLDAHENGTLQFRQFGIFMITAVIGLILVGFIVINSLRDRKTRSFRELLKANTVVSEVDEREKQIATRIGYKNYVTLSNIIILSMVLLPMFFGNNEFSINEILLAIAVFVTFDGLLFFYRFRKVYID